MADFECLPVGRNHGDAIADLDGSTHALGRIGHDSDGRTKLRFDLHVRLAIPHHEASRGV